MIGVGGPGRGVGHREIERDVAQGGEEDPGVAVDRGAIDHLGDQLGDGWIEEAEGAGAVGERHRVAGAGRAGVGIGELDVEAEAVAVQAEAGGGGRAGGGGEPLQGEARVVGPHDGQVAVLLRVEQLHLFGVLVLRPDGEGRTVESAARIDPLEREGGHEVWRVGRVHRVIGHRGPPQQVDGDVVDQGRRHQVGTIGDGGCDGYRRRDRRAVEVPELRQDGGGAVRRVRVAHGPTDDEAAGGVCREPRVAAGGGAQHLDRRADRRAESVEALPGERRAGALIVQNDEPAVGDGRQAPQVAVRGGEGEEAGHRLSRGGEDGSRAGPRLSSTGARAVGVQQA